MIAFGEKAVQTLNLVANLIDKDMELHVKAVDFLHKTSFAEPQEHDDGIVFAWLFPQDGALDIYLEAVVHYAHFLGTDPVDLLVKVFFTHLYFAITDSRGKPRNFSRAEKFANRVMEKRLNKKYGLSFDIRPVLYANENTPYITSQGLEAWYRMWKAKGLEAENHDVHDEHTPG